MDQQYSFSKDDDDKMVVVVVVVVCMSVCVSAKVSATERKYSKRKITSTLDSCYCYLLEL